MRRRDGRRRAGGDRELRGHAHDAVGRRLRAVGRAPDRRRRAPPGDDEPGEHDLRGQAADGPQVRGRRGAASRADLPVRGRRRAQRRRARPHPRPRLLAARGVGAGARQDAPDRRGLARRDRQRGGGHRPGVLRRRPAPGDQGRRQDRPQRPAHRQRADRGRAYGMETQGAQKVAVYDLGGGTFDVSILELADGVFRVCSTAGDTFLGGEDFDNAVVEFLLAQFSEANGGMDLRGDRMALQRLKEAAERAKIELSSSAETEINLPFIAASDQGPAPPPADARAHRARGARRAARAADARAVQPRAVRRGHRREGHRRRHPRRRPDAHAAHPHARRRHVRQGSEPAGQPRRGRRGRRRDPGRRAHRRGAGGASCSTSRRCRSAS